MQIVIPLECSFFLSWASSDKPNWPVLFPRPPVLYRFVFGMQGFPFCIA